MVLGRRKFIPMYILILVSNKSLKSAQMLKTINIQMIYFILLDLTFGHDLKCIYERGTHIFQFKALIHTFFCHNKEGNTLIFRGRISWNWEEPAEIGRNQEEPISFGGRNQEELGGTGRNQEEPGGTGRNPFSITRASLLNFITVTTKMYTVVIMS